MSMRKYFDSWSVLVMVITLVLFLTALFNKGLTHDLLLEAGVFLVSVKLILLGYKSSVSNAAIEKKLDEIYSVLQPPVTPGASDSRPQSNRPQCDDDPSEE